jgi:uncharacterized protein YdeI (YjbR/CyaY-like superfamily)
LNEKAELPTLLFETPEAWAEWLADNLTAQGIWVKFAKKGSGVTSINYDQALKVALCYGWIDGQVQKFDDKFYLQRFTPRRPGSSWSTRNCKYAEELIVEGKVQPAGQVQIDQARADWRWEAAYESPSNLIIPEDFLAELAKNKQAEAFFKTLNRANLYTIYYRLHTAKTPQTRNARLQKIIATLAAGQKFH